MRRQGNARNGMGCYFWDPLRMVVCHSKSLIPRQCRVCLRHLHRSSLGFVHFFSFVCCVIVRASIPKLHGRNIYSWLSLRLIPVKGRSWIVCLLSFFTMQERGKTGEKGMKGLPINFVLIQEEEKTLSQNEKWNQLNLIVGLFAHYHFCHAILKSHLFCSMMRQPIVKDMQQRNDYNESFICRYLLTAATASITSNR